jgi:transposase InsO family protein
MKAIDKYSDIVKPLHLMIPNYKTSTAYKKLVWTTETEACFSLLIDKVNHCPKLFFMNDQAPICLHTDASQYGIGGYLFQIVDGVQQPIAFISKTLNSTELRWSTPEKEGYAIFYSLMKLEHLLRDCHFTLRTDHKNLTFINTDFREKVKRWKLAIKHFDFDIEYIKGEDNIEADGFSRLCPTPSDPESVEYLNLLLERLPKNIYDKIHAVHNTNAGHVGVEKTIQRLKDSGHTWPKLRQHVKHYVETCDLCQKTSAIKLDIQTMPYTLASYSPFDRVCIDSIGPLTTNDDSKKYILVIIDAFSRFVMLRAISDTTAKSALDGLIEWIGFFGIPSEVVSDNGTQFANELVEELLELLATENTKIQAYSKEENAIVERANKEVNRHLRAYAYERKDRKTWYKYLPLVQRILNASTHKSIGVSPAQIVFGNAVQLDRQLLPLAESTSSSTKKHIRNI